MPVNSTPLQCQLLTQDLPCNQHAAPNQLLWGLQQWLLHQLKVRHGSVHGPEAVATVPTTHPASLQLH